MGKSPYKLFEKLHGLICTTKISQEQDLASRYIPQLASPTLRAQRKQVKDCY